MQNISDNTGLANISAINGLANNNALRAINANQFRGGAPLQKLGVFKRYHFDIISILNQYRINIEMISLFFNIVSIL